MLGLRVIATIETGTGKAVVARLIHDLSGRSGPFLAVNCAATVESLLESDLLGHEKGDFTCAYATKRGLWEVAEKRERAFIFGGVPKANVLTLLKNTTVP